MTKTNGEVERMPKRSRCFGNQKFCSQVYQPEGLSWAAKLDIVCSGLLEAALKARFDFKQVYLHLSDGKTYTRDWGEPRGAVDAGGQGTRGRR